MPPAHRRNLRHYLTRSAWELTLFPTQLEKFGLFRLAETAHFQALLRRVADRIRTGDRLDHNQELYQLSYSHHALSI
jgi:hypothetical protein